MNEIKITACGTVGTDPSVREVNGGESLVTSFRLASTPRVRDRQTNVWRDQPTSWLQVNCWRQLGVNVADCVHKGQRVIVHGRLVVREWTTDDGQYRTRADIEADAVGFDLGYGRGTFEKVNWAQPRPVPGQRELDEMAEAAESITRGLDVAALLAEVDPEGTAAPDPGADPDALHRGGDGAGEVDLDEGEQASARALGELVGRG